MVCPENRFFNFLKSVSGQFNKNDDELTLSQIGRLTFYRFYCFPQQELISETAKQMREFAALYGFEFRSEGAFDFKQFVKGLEWFIENAKCPGCRQGGGPPWCEVKKCCLERGLRICFECEEFPCSKFKEYADPDTMDRYKRFKEIGFEKWVEEQTQKVREGYEIHLQKVASLRP